MRARIVDRDLAKILQSDNYNYMFDKQSGFFARWGKTKEDDPDFSPFGPEILDIEVTTKCKGPGNKLCKFCYKSNTPNGKNMSFKTFKTILNKLPRTLTQCAFGADAQAESNPDLWKMMDYCRNNSYNQIVPNITVADISDETADKLVKYCGAVAVSRYADKEYCYNSVKRLTDRDLSQTNIHIMISEETFDQAIETINDYKHDERLSKLNAIVFLSLKQKGRGTDFNPLSMVKFKQLVDLALDTQTPIGFDSCSANKFLASIKGRDNYKQLEQMTEPCESLCFSAYVDVNATFFPCSFSTCCSGWDSGIDMLECQDFLKDVWFNEKSIQYRQNIIKCGRNCMFYKI